MSYRVEILPRARKEYARLPDDVRSRIIAAIAGLASEPRPPGVRKLVESPLWRIRVGRYRIIYSISDRDRLIVVTQISPRNENTYG